ncbi:MAG: hypothetical protein A2521_02310 [Deltaproteobacteria bacterium RIFOXYD12_FULL_57_12]|nr:MAG: hypothetical protein A2521_02310 [Deltaproteobacteria bacterium RIFOXYD12_FULL_57_12]
MEKIRIVIADDHAVVREGLKELLNNQSDLEVIGEAEDGQRALEIAKRLKPDVLLLDIAMPVLNGLEVVRLLKEAEPRVQIVILSMFLKEAYVYQALSAGVLGYMLKTASGAEVIKAVRAAACNKFYLSPEINHEVIRKYLEKGSAAPSDNARYNLLSDREQQIFRLVVEGNSTRRIAEMLYLSPKTVEKHRANISKKLGMNDPLAMMRYAIKIGVIDPELWTAD